MKKLLLLLTTLMVFSFGFSQNFKWAKSMGGTGIDYGPYITVDNSGNIYTTGSFNGTADFDPDAGTLNLVTSGSTDVYIAKYNTNGNLIWAKSIGGPNSDRAYSIATDSSGNVYTMGEFSGTVDFDPGTGTFNVTSSGTNHFILKLNSSGNFVFAKITGGTNTPANCGITIDKSGNIYATGAFSFTDDFDPGPGIFNLTSNGNSDDIFITKLDAFGDLVWAKSIGGTSIDESYSINVDALGNIFTTGVFSSVSDFDPGPGVFNLTSNGDLDIFISKLDASGNFVWAISNGGSKQDAGISLKLDPSCHIYTTGFFQGTVDFDPGSGSANLTSLGDRDIYVSKLDSSGNFVWSKNMGGTGIDRGYSLALDASVNIYTVGEFKGTADLDPGSAINNLFSSGLEDIFILKLDSSGNFASVRSMGGANQDEGLSIALDANGNIYTGSWFGGTVDFDPGAGTSNLTSMGYQDIFISKLGSSTGIKELIHKNDIAISPNPANDIITIQLLSSKGYPAYSITDETGRPVLNGMLNDKETKIDISELYGGFYFIKIGDLRTVMFKLVKN